MEVSSDPMYSPSCIFSPLAFFRMAFRRMDAEPFVATRLGICNSSETSQTVRSEFDANLLDSVQIGDDVLIR